MTIIKFRVTVTPGMINIDSEENISDSDSFSYSKASNVHGIQVNNPERHDLLLDLCDNIAAGIERILNNEAVMDSVVIGSQWQHTNGNEYEVTDITNEGSTKSLYPVTVVYKGANGKSWSRPLSDWARSMTAIEPSMSIR